MRFTALELKVDTRRRRQFIRGLCRQGRARKVLDSDGRQVYAGKLMKNRRSIQALCIYEWVK